MTTPTQCYCTDTELSVPHMTDDHEPTPNKYKTDLLQALARLDEMAVWGYEQNDKGDYEQAQKDYQFIKDFINNRI